MNFVEKGVKIFILTTLSIAFRGAAELYCIEFTYSDTSPDYSFSRNKGL